MKLSKLAVLSFSFAAFLALAASAAELDGVKFVDQIKIDGKPLVLNGLGIRHKTIFQVKVYVGALYLPKKTSDAKQILDSPETKRVELAFVHAAPADKIRDSWDELQEFCKPGCQEYQAAIEQLKSKMVDLKVGDTMAFDLFPDRVTVWVKGKQVDVIRKAGFSKILLSTWLSEHPVEDDLKSGLLGQKS